MNLSAQETRVLGCLLEKQRTTPDAYPLSLNALRLACNQSTNRDPVVDYDEATIRDAVHRLERRGLARLASGRGSRATKYRHLLADALPLRDEEQAVMCVLLLRGAQTPGELKQRTERVHRFADLEDVLAALRSLGERGLVERLERRPGQKEDRYRQLLERDGDEQFEPAAAEPASVGVRAAAGGASENRESGARGEDGAAALLSGRLDGDDSRLGELERRVTRLERELAELRAGIVAGTRGPGGA
jgi:uncharacterized protein YceH (UPF0502 family)